MNVAIRRSRPRWITKSIALAVLMPRVAAAQGAAQSPPDVPPAVVPEAQSPSVAPAAPVAPPAAARPVEPPAAEPAVPASVPAPPVNPAAPTEPAADAQAEAAVPFAFADFGWMNGQSRQTEFPLAGKVIQPMFTIDAGYNYEFSHPRDHTIVGSTAAGRSNEFQIMHLGVGADFGYKNVRGRIMTQLGLYSTMTPRNDASPDRGQWNLRDAYKYITEGYGGYHLNVWNGINIDGGIFLSYVGLDSYYNYENWQDQASYVSSNTPWFFNGVRIQTFPSDKLKIEYWIINGWQSYGEFNEQPGFGVQSFWRPNGNVGLVLSGYFGKDAMGVKDRVRFHTDNSLLVKYYENTSADAFLNKVAFSLTVDAGCEEGGGNGYTHVSCGGGSEASPDQYFLGAMFYNRMWFDDNKFGFTFGGGVMTNPGRYLVLTPPINGATAYTLSPYFTQNPGDKFKAWDTTETFDWMPSQFYTLRMEYTHRQASVPYFAGPNGVTPQVATGVYSNVGAPGSTVPGFTPDLQKSENRITMNFLVRL
jgi:hypothetical protein